MAAREIKVLIVEDSTVASELLIHILSADPAIRVSGVARHGREALEQLAKTKPDLITMDIQMPGMDGFEVTRQIMETQPVPIVIVSGGYHAEDVAMTFRALEAGAVAAVEKPPGLTHVDFPRLAGKLVSTVKAMAEVRVIRRWTRERQGPRAASPVIPEVRKTPANSPIELVAIGASTGGPPVLQTILRGLGQPFPVPILVVQHIAAGFVEGLVDWLAQTTGMPVCLASHGARTLPGHVYIAPDGLHLRVEKGGRLSCLADPPENGLRPAVSCLFRSVEKVCARRAVGVLLTGMGRDGADELKRLRDAGAVTFCQDRESSIVHGMPGEAIKIGAAAYTLAPAAIAGALKALVAR